MSKFKVRLASGSGALGKPGAFCVAGLAMWHFLAGLILGWVTAAFAIMAFAYSFIRGWAE